MDYMLLDISNLVSGKLDLNAVMFFFITVAVPILSLFISLCYIVGLRSRRRRENDKLILALTDKGQVLTPELIAAIREDDKIRKNTPTMGNAYRKLFMGLGLIICGVIVFIAINHVIAAFFWIFGICIMCQGVALWLAVRSANAASNPTENESITTGSTSNQQ